jgi:Leucine-rich repeat (LRR) protein
MIPSNGNQVSCVVRPRGWRHLLFILVFALGPMFRGMGADCDPAPSGIISWWPGDGNAQDIAGTNNGTLEGGATAGATGLVGLAFSFDGTNNYVQIPDSASLKPTNLTVEAWVLFASLNSGPSNATAPQGTQYIVFKQNSQSENFEGFSLGKTRLSSRDAINFEVTSVTGTNLELDSVTSIASNVWYHVAGVRGSNFLQLYINGVLESQTNVTFAQNYGTLPLYFGTTGQPSWDRKFKGVLDEVSLYNRALASNEVYSIYAAASAGKCKAPNITSQPQSQSLTVGSNATFSVGATGFGSLSYQWRFNSTNLPSATNASLALTNIQLPNAGPYTVVVTNNLGSVTSAVATLTVWVPPSISSQPQSLTNIVGATAAFNVSASGTPSPAYQWQFNGNTLSAATGASLLLTNVQLTNAGNYSVVVSNAAGSLTSAVAALTVWAPPSISSQPQSLTNIVGTIAAFNVSASGTPSPAYQWRFNGNNLSAATSPSLALTNVQLTNAGNYSVVVSNAAGSLTSAVAALTIWAPPSISSQPQSVTNIVGTTAAFNVSASGTPSPAYQWQFNGNNLSAATSPSLLLTNVQLTNAGNYSVVVSNAAGSLTSAVAALTVWAPPSISSQPQSLTNIVGTIAAFNVSASGTPSPAYQWQFNGNNLSAATGPSLALTNVQLTNAGNYSVVVSNAAGSLTSAIAALTVWAPPSISSQPQSLTNIVGTIAAFNVSASGTPSPAYQWQFNGNNLSAATSPSLALTNVQLTNAGSYSVVVSNAAGSLTSAVAALTVWAPPSISSQPQSLTNIVGTTAAFNVSASGTPSPAYQWQFNGSTLSTATGASLLLTNVQLTNAGNYSVVVSNAAGSLTSAVAALTVWAPPSISSQPQSLTNIVGTTAAFNVSASGTPSPAYQWQFNGNPLSAATSPSLLLTNIQLTNAGNYSVVVSNAAGSLTSAVAALTVWAPPSISSQPQGLTNIVGTTAAFNVSASGTPSPAYQWQFNGNPLSAATSPSLLLTNVQLTNAGNYSVVVSNAAGSLTSAVAVLTVWAPPSISSQPQSLTNYVGTTASFSVSASGTPSPAYQWQFNGNNLTAATGTSLLLSNVQLTNAGNYTVVVSNSVGSVTSAVATLAVWVPTAPVILSQPQSQSNLIGTAASFSVVAAGTLPLGYQWQFNGTNLGGETGTNLVLGGVQETNAGNYTVVVTNLAGSVTSAVAVLTVLLPPFITTQPLSQSMLARPWPACMSAACASASLSAAAGGTQPLAYQWQLNGASLANSSRITGATTNLLVIAGPEPADTGNYTLVVSNAFGAVTTSVASLTVSAPLIADLNLEDAIRLALQKPAGALACSDLALLTNLVAPGAHIYDLSGLECATSLQTLYLSGNCISNLTPLGSLTQLKALSLANNQGMLADISPLAGLTNLTFLDLRWNPGIASFASLASLTNLTSLYLGGNSIDDLGFLSGLTQLTFLDLDNTGLTDATPLAVLPRLAGLDLGYDPLRDPTQLSAFTNLATLYLSGTGLTDLAFVQNLTALTSLVVYTNAISDLSPLAALTNLTTLNAGGNPITNFSALSALPNLSALWLHACSLTNPAFLSGLSQLTYLNLNDNLVTNCSSLSGLTNLTTLSLSVNSYSDVSPLAGLFRLTWLSLATNQISNVSPLPALTNLAYLDLSSNSISDVSPLTNLVGLIWLNAAANQSPDITPLGSLTALASLDISQDQVSNTSSLSSLTNLSSLNLNFDPVTNWSFLSDLPQLSTLRLRSSSVSETSLLSCMPHLTTLDVGLNSWGDFSALAGATNLHCLYADSNLVSDVSALQCLPRLWQVDARKNLLDLGVDSGSMAIIQCLTNRGVDVLFEPQHNHPGATFSNLAVVSGANYWAIPAGRTSTLAFQVSDDVKPVQQLVVTPSSSNQGVVPNSALIAGGTATNRTLQVTPSSAGQTVLTLSLNDGSAFSGTASITVVALVPQTVSIPDRTLKTALRAALGISGNSITNFAMLNLTQLSVNNSTIANLSGLQTATNLASLSLNGNSITTLSPLQNLSALTYLSLSNNVIGDSSPLAGLTNLNYLALSANPLTNDSGVSGLTNLTTLLLDGDNITNLAFLLNLDDLVTLNLADNRITDVSPLAGLTNLSVLSLQNNLLSNIVSLTSLSHLVWADLSLNLLDLGSNSVATATIDAMQDDGADIIDQPQRTPPSIAAPTYWGLAPGATSSISVSVSDTVASPAQILVSASCSAPALVPATNFLAPNPASGGSGYVLTLTGIAGPTNATVTVTATNDAGLGTNAIIEVTISDPMPDGSNDLSWATWGDALWFSQTNVTASPAAAESGPLSDGQSSWLQTTVTGPGRLTFSWKVSSQTNSDWLSFLINNTTQNAISGEVDWSQQVVYLDAGTQMLDWAYTKDPANSSGADAGWVADVTFQPGSWLQLAGAPVTNQCQLILHGVQGNLYTVMVGTNLTNWSSLVPSILLTNSVVPFLDTNVVPGNRFYRLRGS